jgi:hypothetical protein
MTKSAAIMELVSGYEAYADVEELNVSAAAGAPATAWICVSVIASRVSSAKCAGWASLGASAVSGATYERNC